MATSECGRSFWNYCRTRFGSCERYEERVYQFEGEADVGKLFNGLGHIERSGVPNGI